MKENFENVKELIIKLRERFSILNTKMQVVQLDFREGVILQINESKNSNSAFTDKLRNLHHANHKIHADRNLTAVIIIIHQYGCSQGFTKSSVFGNRRCIKFIELLFETRYAVTNTGS